MKKAITFLLVSVLLLGLCAGISACGTGPGATSGSPQTSMPTFASGEDLVSAFANGRSVGMGFGEKSDMSLSRTEEAIPGAPSDESAEYSTTNVQVAGVDEADIVKNDGRYIYAVSGQSVFVLLAYPAEEARVVSEIGLDRGLTPDELFVEGDKLVVIGLSYQYEVEPYEGGEVPPSGDTTFISIYDVANREEPRHLRTIEYEGHYSTSRMVGEDVYVVLTGYPYYALYDGESIEASDIIPRFRDNREGQEMEGFGPVCDARDVEYVDPERFTSFLSILAFSLKGETGDLDRRVIAGYSENVYASTDNLYVASTDYQYGFYREEMIRPAEEKTTIYKFKLDGPRTTFLRAAEVPGTVLNQFSMDESGGYFRIATTSSQLTRDMATSTNNVYILDPEQQIVGSLEGLAPGETIYSARFMGDRAYLVTFEQIDPFFVLDLSDPRDPKVLGALKIPGYSDYLHPYDEDHVIGVGKNTVAAPLEDGASVWEQGIKIAIFDVSDVANPKEMHRVDIGQSGTDSYALYDHRAFLFDRERNLMVLPVLLAEPIPEQGSSPDIQEFGYGNYTFQGAYAYDITLERGINLRGRVTHVDDPGALQDYYYYDSADAVRRSLYIENNLYTVSEARVKINELRELAEVGNIELNEFTSGI